MADAIRLSAAPATPGQLCHVGKSNRQSDNLTHNAG